MIDGTSLQFSDVHLAKKHREGGWGVGGLYPNIQKMSRAVIYGNVVHTQIPTYY